MHSSLIIVKWI